MIKQMLFAGFAFLVSVPVAAAAIEKLHQFLQSTHSLRADFTQTVIGRNSHPGQASSGVMMISRPGKFRWQIDKPYSQLLVGDGQKVWIYDPDLRQVTVKKASLALGGTPAALLAGDNTLEKAFDLREVGEHEGLDWLEAIPKSTESGFEKIRLGFSGNELRAMNLLDSLGQTSALLFSHVERNPRLPPTLFRFSPPVGTDVLGE